MTIRETVLWMLALAAVGGAAAGCGSDRFAGPDASGDDEVPIVSAGDFDASVSDFAASTKKPFTRVDRMGMPAIATAVISSKDAYNQANPTDDAAGLFVPEIVASIDGLHAALDDDLTDLGLTPRATGDCVGQAAPFVVPDVIRIDPSQPSGFPNGRRLTDPVIDVTLGLVLLDLNAHPVTTLIGVNPTANDRRFRRHFPYLGRRHIAFGDQDKDDDGALERMDD